MIEYSFFGKDAKMHHLGLVVKSIRSIDSILEITRDDVQKVNISFLKIDGIAIELLEPLGEDSPVWNSLQSGSKILHICLEVDSIKESLDKGRSFGFHSISSRTPAPALGGRDIIWMYHKCYGLFELVERNK